MQQADFQRFHAIMTGMAKVYEREIDNPLLDAYWLALGDWSLGEFERGAATLMRTSKFMPRPADFNDLRKADRPTAGEAWARVLEHCKRGRYRDGSGIDPEIDQAVRALGGYRAIAMTEVDQLRFVERRFAEHYGDIEGAQDARAALGLEPGPEDKWFLPPRDMPKGPAKL